MADKPEIFVNIAPALVNKTRDEWVNVWQIKSLYVKKGRRVYKHVRRDEWKYKRLLNAASQEKNIFRRFCIMLNAKMNKPMYFFSTGFLAASVVITLVDSKSISVGFRSNKEAEKGYKILRSMLITPFEVKKNVDD